MALNVYLRPEDKNKTLTFEQTDKVTLRIPPNNGDFPMGFTVFLVAAGVQEVEVVPDTVDVTLPSYLPKLSSEQEIGILRNTNGLNNWSYSLARPYPGSDIVEAALVADVTLDDNSVTWQVLDCNGQDRAVNIVSTLKAKEFLIINDGTANSLLIQENTASVDSLGPGESLWCKRLSTKWIALRFAQHGISNS